MNVMEGAAKGEELVDFCLWPYPPVRPVDGKIASVNLLANSFETEGVAPRALDVVRGIRAEIGRSRTVWGIKQAGAEIGWELYFYDYDRCQRTRSIPRLLRTLRPWISCGIDPGEHIPYFMFSLEFTKALLADGGTLDAVQMYIGNIGSTVSSGICYELTRERTRLKNFYFFFDARREIGEIEGKILTSAYLDPSAMVLDSILFPELRSCEVIVVANKPDRDGVYFSRIDVTQLLWFLKRMGYPESQVGFVESNVDRLDHLLFDVGFDYRMEGGRLRILKSAYYGTF